MENITDEADFLMWAAERIGLANEENIFGW
jgi:hypothetical protein